MGPSFPNLQWLAWWFLYLGMNNCFLMKEDKYKLLDGQFAKEAQFPWIVSVLSSDESFLCAGVLVDKQWALVAAHCIQCTPPNKCEEPHHLNYGSTHKTNGSIAAIEKYILHPQFNPNTNQDDLALIKLQRVIQEGLLTKVAPIKNLEDSSPEWNECVNVGWGVPCKNDIILSDRLYYYKSPIIALEECKKHWSEVNGHNICSRPLYSKGFCIRDAGNLLICGNKLIGTSSYGHQVSAYATSLVFTKIAPYKEWLESVIGNLASVNK